ncbi:Phosphopentomutase [Clostridiaceae bacterium JG1575]|nr:Phosphopentomutase [Clostridiaceae bacterium JG1575]
MKRAVLLILDSVGIGEMPDAKEYGDTGSNTLGNTAAELGGLHLPHLQALGLGNIHPIMGVAAEERPQGAYGKAAESSVGKDTVTGHWEIAGCVLETPLNTYPNGFPQEIMDEFHRRIGRETLGNEVASGTEIIKELGEEHMATGKPIVYTSADSVFQIAAHEQIIPLPELYRMCEIAREMLKGEWTVGRVIARPFIGSSKQTFQRTSNRHDYSLDPCCKTILDYVKEAGMDVCGVGKINDIFNGKGITETVRIQNNMDGVDKTLDFLRQDKNGLLFINLVDFDMLYGHRNDPAGYGKALEEVDARMPEILGALKQEDLLIISADHGCDPTTPSTDHSREYIPILMTGAGVTPRNLGIRKSFTDIGKTILEYLSIPNELFGESFLRD